ncbi:MAG TPA: FAD-dependent oxidoreductase, partial [Nitrospirota bacterium]|nr:FAD-dependent oxidoreductase [Nitrospirota bacterium]
LGGLAAAALLTRQKKRTVLIESGDFAGGSLASVRRNGFLFSPGKTLSFGFERGGLLQRFCSDLGIHQNTAVLSPCYQVLLPDRRISIYQETGETLEELAREFPGEMDILRRFYRDLRSVSESVAKSRFTAFRARRRNAGAYLAHYQFSKELLALFDVQSRCFYRCPVSELSLQSLITLVDTSPLSVLGGFSQFVEQVLSAYLQNNGEIRYGARNVDIMVKGNKAQGLTLAGGDHLDAGLVLVNNPPLQGEGVVFLGIREEVVPLGMAQEVLCLPDYARPELLFTLSISRRDQETVAPHGTRALTASFPMLSRNTLSLNALLEVISGTIPFLERFILHAEEQAGTPPVVPIPEKSPRSSSGTHECGTFFQSTHLKNLYVIDDSPQSPYCVVSAARRIVEQIR